MKAIRMIGWVLSTAVLAAGAEQARPHRTLQASGADKAASENRAQRGMRSDRPPTDQEWANVIQWMMKHSPNRLAFYQTRMPRQQAQLQQAKQLIWNQYQTLQAVNYPPLKDAMVAQAEAQDQVFGAQIALRESQTSHSAEQQDQAREALRTAVRKLVDGEQHVIEARIEKVQKDLERMNGNLERLKNNKDRRVQQIFRQKLYQAGILRTQDAAPPAEEAPPQE